MGALYVKDDEVRRMAEKLAGQRGLTKVAAVRLALANELAKDERKLSVHEIVAELRRTSALPKTNVGIADKAFFDNLYDDELYDVED